MNDESSSIRRFRWTAWFLAFLMLPALAGEFSVSPIRLDLGGLARSGAVIVRNDDTKQLSFQIRGAEWTQDAQGADVYSEAGDLVYFPKLLVIPAAAEAVVRVGVRQPLVQSEKAYRLFIEELPSPEHEGGAAGGRVRVLMRFGVPIFVAPVKSRDSIDLEQLELTKGIASLQLTNSGNHHQVMETIQFVGIGKDGATIFSRQIADRYLLAGTRKIFTVAIPAEQCGSLAGLSFQLKTTRDEARRHMDVNSSMCR